MEIEKLIVFRGKVRKQAQGDFVGLDDIVCINGVIGWLDFIGEEAINVISEDGSDNIIPIKDIRSVEKYSTFIEGNRSNTLINSLLSFA